MNKRNVYTSSGSSWSWTRSGTVWDDGRNDWSESWSKSSWKDGKYLPSESDSKNGSFDPKKTGQTNDVPKFGEAPRLNKPQKNGPVDLTKPPKKQQPQPSKELFELPIVYNEEETQKKFSGDFFAGNPAPRKPTFKEQIEKLLKSGAIANYQRIVDLIMKASQTDRRTITQNGPMMRLIGNSFGSKPELSIPIVASLLKGEQRWSNPNNHFTNHFLQNTEKALDFNDQMNCWEMILYAAFLCAQITGSQIKKFMESTYPTGRQMATMGYSNDLPFYPGRGPNNSSKTKTPQPGDLVYFRHFTPFPGHVAVLLSGSLVVSLWEYPNLGDGNYNRIQIFDIKDLPGQVQIGPPLTQAIKDGKI